MTKYECPKCGMEFDAPGNCEMCDVKLEKTKEQKEEDQIK